MRRIVQLTLAEVEPAMREWCKRHEIEIGGPPRFVRLDDGAWMLELQTPDLQAVETALARARLER